MPAPRLFAYARVTSPQTPAENAREIFKQAGYRIDSRRYVEEQVPRYVSAENRPGLQGLIGRVKKGDSLIVTAMDCLGQNIADVVNIIELLGERGVGLVVLELGDLDLTAEAGRLVLKTLLAAANLERERMSACSQLGRARAHAEGTHIGRPSKTTPEERQTIRELLAQGVSVSEVARRFSIPGERTICRTTVMNIRDSA